MTTDDLHLRAGDPIEPQRHAVGHAATLLADPERGGRLLGIDIWYPSLHAGSPTDGAGTPTRYELFPGVSFASAGAHDGRAAGPGRFPLIVFSHGRTGMRFAYSLLCEALAARGAVVVSADHPGDALTDWLLGTHVDDRTNEVNRVGDAHFLLHALLHGHDAVPVDVLNAIDPDRVVLAGHSYGAYTALATVAGSRGVLPHDRVHAAVVLQPYTRIMSDGLLGRIRVPVLMAVGGRDGTTPPDTDAERPWALIPGRPMWRLDLHSAGHQASSDIALYAELAPQVPGLPQIVTDYLAVTAVDAVGPGMPPWRDTLRTQVAVTWSFLGEVLNLDEPAAVPSSLGDASLRVLQP